jgi:glutaredoxin 3
MLDEDFTREELFEKFPTARTFPQIVVDGESIGGFTELKELVNSRRT